jgi:hypothetical protein
MRLAIATVFAYFLTACASIPGEQTLGLSRDPDATHKAAIVATTLAVDALHVYATLPECGSGIGDMCKKPKAYRDAKLMTVSFAETLKGPRPSVFLTAGLLYYQYSLAKRLAGAPSPTDPEAAPSDSVAKQLAALKAADILVSLADDRVQDAFSVNTSAADLMAELESKVAALP